MTAAWQKEKVRKPRGSQRKERTCGQGDSKRGSNRQTEKAPDGQKDSERETDSKGELC